ncbi:MAG: hypothetical protein WCH62_07730 [Candidatus Omnitrophota bacterium]
MHIFAYTSLMRNAQKDIRGFLIYTDRFVLMHKNESDFSFSVRNGDRFNTLVRLGKKYDPPERMYSAPFELLYPQYYRNDNSKYILQSDLPGKSGDHSELNNVGSDNGLWRNR